MMLPSTEHCILIPPCPSPAALPWAGNRLSEPVSFSVQWGPNRVLCIPGRHEDHRESAKGTSFGNYTLLYL